MVFERMIDKAGSAMTTNTSQPKNRYCTDCGTKMKGDSANCPLCHAPGGRTESYGIPRTGAGGIGYSKKIDDPGFGKSKGKTRVVSLVCFFAFSVVFAGVMLLIFKLNLIAAAVIAGALFVIITVPYLISTRRKKSWEGTVEEKKILSAMSRYENLNVRHKYRILFKTADGRRKVWTDDHLYTNVFDYLEEGDRVRYVGKIGTKCAFEKYDKSNDQDIMCLSCAALNDARNNHCHMCGCLLPKG